MFEQLDAFVEIPFTRAFFGSNHIYLVSFYILENPSYSLTLFIIVLVLDDDEEEEEELEPKSWPLVAFIYPRLYQGQLDVDHHLDKIPIKNYTLFLGIEQYIFIIF